MELWELSDGRVWQIEPKLGGFSASSFLSNGALSRIGWFMNHQEIEDFAQNYLRLTVTEKVSE